MDTVPSNAMEEVINILMCPVCEGQVCKDDSSQSRLVCLCCDERYGTVDGIPVMIPERVRPVSPELVQLYSSVPVRTGPEEHAAYIAAHTAHISDWVNLDGKLVVDLGGAEGLLSTRLAGTKQVIIADISLPRLRQGVNRKMSNATFVCGDLQTPFLKSQADVVLLMSVLEHVSSPDVVLRNAVRMLRPRGVLIVYVPVCNLPLNRLAVWLFRKLKRIDMEEARKQHLRVYSTASLRAQILTAGLSVEDLTYTSIFSELNVPEALVKSAAKSHVLNTLLASGLYLLARKPRKADSS